MKKSSVRGTSLVEVLFALMILSSTFIFLFQVLNVGMKGTERLSEESYAANHAVSLLASISSLSYSQIPEVPVGTLDKDIKPLFVKVPDFSFFSLPEDEFPRTIEISEITKRIEDDSSGDNSRWGSLKEISVTVTWHPNYLKKHIKKSRSFRALVTNDMEIFK